MSRDTKSAAKTDFPCFFEYIWASFYWGILENHTLTTYRFLWFKIEPLQTQLFFAKQCFADFEKHQYLCFVFTKTKHVFQFLGSPCTAWNFKFQKNTKRTYFSENSGFLWFFLENEDKLRIPKVRYQWQSVLKTVKPDQKWSGFQFPTEKS